MCPSKEFIRVWKVEGALLVSPKGTRGIQSVQKELRKQSWECPVREFGPGGTLTTGR